MGTQQHPALDIWLGLLQAQSAVLETLEAELADEDLPMSWYEVLARLARAPDGRMRMQDLAREVLLSKSGITRLSDRMEEAGLIERASCPTDRRGTFAQITTDGQTRYERAAPLVYRGVDRSLAKILTDHEQEVLRGAFSKLIAGSEPA